jgi:hypothetical protein
MVNGTSLFGISVPLWHETRGKKHMEQLSLWEVQAMK